MDVADPQQEEQKQSSIDDKPADEQVNWSIERMARYRVAGDGGVATEDGESGRSEDALDFSASWGLAETIAEERVSK